MSAEGVADFVITPHARAEAQRRQLKEEIIRQVLSQPEQRLQVRTGREVFQSRIQMGAAGHLYLVRVFVDVDRWPPEVVTVYRTSRVDKYWRTEA